MEKLNDVEFGSLKVDMGQSVRSVILLGDPNRYRLMYDDKVKSGEITCTPGIHM